jgi:hypothetical protein
LQQPVKRWGWDKQNQLLYWYPEKDQTLNQIIIAKEHIDNKVDLINSSLPKKARSLLEKAKFVTTFLYDTRFFKFYLSYLFCIYLLIFTNLQHTFIPHDDHKSIDHRT